eukprot:TRINITY_DN310_c3_g1_i1.p1 TRINITY_DN310_c3_g1~~TRINITY_DN310_c3_g1_i1.p1  ORF type:complete len:1110 (-),score=223.39 TRINITY_DN310_c3_g1_i1:1411-4740(-)
MMIFKDEKMAALQSEIDRLRTVLRVQTGLARETDKVPGDASFSKLEKRIDEMAEKGKLEFKIVVPQEEGEPISNKELVRVLNMPPSSLAKTVIFQGKILEDYLKEAEAAISDAKERMEAKLEEVTQERNNLEAEMNRILTREQNMAKALGKIVSYFKETTKDPEILRRVKDTEMQGNYEMGTGIGEIESTAKDWIFPREISVRQPNGTVETLGIIQSLKDAHELVEKYISEKKLRQAADVWRELGYDISGLNEFEAATRLRAICQAKDMQIKELAEAIPDDETIAKCVELPEEGFLEVVADYETMKAKGRVKESEQAKYHQEQIERLTRKIKDLHEALQEKDRIIKEQAERVVFMGETLNSLQDSGQEKKIISEKQRRIEELEACLSLRSQGDSVDQTRRTEQRPFTAVPNSPACPAKVEAVSETEKVKTLIAENAKNRELIRDLMSEGKDPSKVNRILYDNNVELNEKLLVLNEEVEQIKVHLQELSEEHKKTLMALHKVVKKEWDNEVPSQAVEGTVVNELYIAKKINATLSELLFAVEDDKVTVSPDRMLLHSETCFKMRESANKAYKDFFEEERLYDVTAESLLKRLKAKNTIFKELFNICEKLLALNQDLLAAKPNLKGTSHEQIFAEAKNASTTSDDKVKTLESKILYLNTKLLECNKEMDKQEDLIKQKNRSIELMELELGKRESENKRLFDILGATQREQSARTSEIDALKVKCETLQKELLVEREKITNCEAERIEAESLKRELGWARQELLNKAEEVTGLINENQAVKEQLRTLEAELADTIKAREMTETRLKENMEEYKNSMEECHGQIEELVAKEKENEEYRIGTDDYISQTQKVMEKLKELKQDYVKLTSVSSPTKSQLFQQLSDDFSASTLLIDEVKDRLLNNKKMIESLQVAINTLQGERQLVYQSKKPEISYATSPVYFTPTNLEVPLEATNRKPKQDIMISQLKANVQKYQTWFNTVQEPLRAIAFALDGTFMVEESKGKFTLSQMREIIQRVPETIARLKDEKFTEVEAIRTTLQEEYQAQKVATEKGTALHLADLDKKAKSLQTELLETQKEVKNLTKEKARLETLLQRQREDTGKIYEKGSVSMVIQRQ